MLLLLLEVPSIQPVPVPVSVHRYTDEDFHFEDEPLAVTVNEDAVHFHRDHNRDRVSRLVTKIQLHKKSEPNAKLTTSYLQQVFHVAI